MFRAGEVSDEDNLRGTGHAVFTRRMQDWNALRGKMPVFGSEMCSIIGTAIGTAPVTISDGEYGPDRA